MTVSDFTALLPEWYDPNGGINYSRHNGLAPRGSVTFISYSFLSADELPENSIEFGVMTQYTPLDAMRQAAIRAALGEFEEVAGVRFVEVDDPSHAMMTFQGNIGNGPSWADLPFSSPDWGTDAAAVTMSDDFAYGLNPEYEARLWGRGGGMFTLALHEIGHAMGLEHPHEGRILDPELDSHEYTVMSYNWSWSGGGEYNDISPDMLRPLDIDALRHLYGPETAVPGDWTWSWDETADRFSLTGGAAADVLLAIDAPSLVQGGAGNDAVYGRDHADTLNGGTGNDTTIGGQGDDTHIVDSYADQVVEDWYGGTDTIRTSLSAYSIFGLTQVENLLGSSAAGHVLTGNDLSNAITGHMGHDRLVGGAGNDTLQGSAGNDTLDGGSGDNHLLGGSGDDTYLVFSHGDTVAEAAGGGIDTVQTALATYSIAALEMIENIFSLAQTAATLTGNAQANVLTGTASGDDTLRGASGDDTLTGNAGNDSLDGGAGQDLLIGGAGNDRYLIDSYLDRVTETAGGGSDTITTTLTAWSIYALGHVENLIATGSLGAKLTGNDAANRLTGAQGRDTLIGGAGDDTLNGGARSDVLKGGLGADCFRFTTATGPGNIDLISDFTLGEDRLHLDNAIFTALAAGRLAGSGFHIGASATKAAHRVIYDDATGALHYDSNGNLAGGSVQIATLGAGLALTAADFLVI